MSYINQQLGAIKMKYKLIALYINLILIAVVLFASAYAANVLILTNYE